MIDGMSRLNPLRNPGARRSLSVSPFLSLSVSLVATLLLAAAASNAQDWGNEPYPEERDGYGRYDDDGGWGSPEPAPAPEPSRSTGYESTGPSRPGWSARAGVGFTAAPETLHLNFEFPFSFDRWVSAGPSIQIGLDDDDTIVAPTLDVNVRIADLSGMGLERLKPYGIVGIGLAILDQDERPGDNTDAGFLLNVGFGLEYQVSDHLYLGSQMKLNFLPFRTLGQTFFYSWQVGGLRIAF